MDEKIVQLGSRRIIKKKKRKTIAIRADTRREQKGEKKVGRERTIRRRERQMARERRGSRKRAVWRLKKSKTKATSVYRTNRIKKEEQAKQMNDRH